MNLSNRTMDTNGPPFKCYVYIKTPMLSLDASVQATPCSHGSLADTNAMLMTPHQTQPRSSR